MGAVKNQAMRTGQLSQKQEQSYNRFFVNAFTEADIDEIIESGGAQSKENFIRQAKENIKNKDYWSALMNKAVKDKQFKGRDNKIRRSKFQPNYNTLGDAIYQEYVSAFADERIGFREYKKIGKSKTFYTVRKVVTKSNKVDFGGKTYKGGQFLPKTFKIKR